MSQKKDINHVCIYFTDEIDRTQREIIVSVYILQMTAIESSAA